MQHLCFRMSRGRWAIECLSVVIVLSGVLPRPAHARQDCTDWSPWDRVTAELDFSFQRCGQTATRVERLWRWQNVSDRDAEFSYWIHLRNPFGCRDRVRGAVSTQDTGYRIGICFPLSQVPVLMEASGRRRNQPCH